MNTDGTRTGHGREGHGQDTDGTRTGHGRDTDRTRTTDPSEAPTNQTANPHAISSVKATTLQIFRVFRGQKWVMYQYIIYDRKHK
jgi:hypothetical protein